VTKLLKLTAALVLAREGSPHVGDRVRLLRLSSLLGVKRGRHAAPRLIKLTAQ
jgi:hypothetical protein